MIIHKSKAIEVGKGEWTMCGKFIKYPIKNVSIVWRNTTCKNCLKKEMLGGIKWKKKIKLKKC